MEMVATAKIKKAQERIESARPYALAMMEVLGNVARYAIGASHPLLLEHEKRERVVVIAVTSDRGLAGAFNSNILRMTEDVIARGACGRCRGRCHRRRQEGRLRTSAIAASSRLPPTATSPTSPRSLMPRSIAAHVIPAYEAEEVDAVYIVFNRFKNVAEQKPEIHQLLPIERRVIDEAAEDAEARINAEYQFEPDAESVLALLLPTYVETLVYRALMESAASEHGARRTAMKAATDNASEMITTLTRSYNRARQAAITNEIAEIVGGAAALEEE